VVLELEVLGKQFRNIAAFFTPQTLVLENPDSVCYSQR
jgi:hypothetical protein